MTEEQTRLVEENTRLVGFVLRRYFPNTPGFEREDLFQIGCLGLAKAAKTFDPEKGFTFASYACRVIINQIRMELRKEQERFEYTVVKNGVSLDDKASGDGLTYAEVIPDPASEGGYNYTNIWEVLDGVPPELRMTWIAFRIEGDSQSEVSKRFSISQPQVSKRVAKVDAILKARLKQ